MHVKMWDDAVTFTVTGSGEFPMDMLRHDMAWPEDTDAAATITQRGRRSVRLTAHKARFVTPERWESFGWHFEGKALFPYAHYAAGNGEEWPRGPLTVNQ